MFYSNEIHVNFTFFLVSLNFLFSNGLCNIIYWLRMVEFVRNHTTNLQHVTSVFYRFLVENSANLFATRFSICNNRHAWTILSCRHLESINTNILQRMIACYYWLIPFISRSMLLLDRLFSCIVFKVFQSLSFEMLHNFIGFIQNLWNNLK